MNPLLTLAIPVYNDAKHLRATLDSAIHQAGIVWLYDNASTDGSSDICAEYAAAHAHVSHIRHAENLGAIENFRLPLFACETPYFMWLGAHDLLSETYTAPLLALLKQHPTAALAAPDIRHIEEDGSPRKKYTSLAGWRGLNAAQPLARMDAFIRHFFGKKHDSFLLHGIFRTELLQQVWVETPCTAFDDALLARTAALGPILHSPKATLYARRFAHKRDSLAVKPVEPSRHTALLSILDMAQKQVRSTADLAAFFRIARLLEQRAVKPSRYRRYCLYLKIAALLAVLLLLGMVL